MVKFVDKNLSKFKSIISLKHIMRERALKKLSIKKFQMKTMLSMIAKM